MIVTDKVKEASEVAWGQLDTILESFDYPDLAAYLEYTAPHSLAAAHERRSALPEIKREKIARLMKIPTKAAAAALLLEHASPTLAQERPTNNVSGDPWSDLEAAATMFADAIDRVVESMPAWALPDKLQAWKAAAEQIKEETARLA